ncbi:uncharacterized protein [Chironomus tepperi]|uniref:uncharacterized protein n=1 Tax=Chironomus tepperi TaxID=113505 RepID=UPI00391F730E
MQELNCEFKYDPYPDGKIIYTCFIRNQHIRENMELNIIGKHQPSHSNNSVIDVIFVNCGIKKIPQGLTKIFPNMQDLSVWHSNLKEVTKNDLKEYKNLLRFGFCDDKIETLYGDLFEGFEDVQELAFTNNKNLKFIEPNILDGLENLKMVNFTGNSKYFKHFSNISGDLGNATLAEVKAELYAKFCSNPEHVKHAFQKHKVDIDKLKAIVAAKDQEIQELKLKEENLQKQINCKEKREVNLINCLQKEQHEHAILKLKLERGIIHDIKQLLLNDNLKDFTINIDNHEFRVHKFLLIAGSPTLAEILQKNPHAENLNLIDIPIEIFEVILKFLYFDEFILDDGTNFLKLFAAAGRLQIEKLKKIAASKILNQINADNALDVLSMSIKYENNELRMKSFAEIKKIYPNFPDEWANDSERVKKAIKLIKEKEAAIKKIEENFWSEMKNN